MRKPKSLLIASGRRFSSWRVTSFGLSVLVFAGVGLGAAQDSTALGSLGVYTAAQGWTQPQVAGQPVATPTFGRSNRLSAELARDLRAQTEQDLIRVNAEYEAMTHRVSRLQHDLREHLKWSTRMSNTPWMVSVWHGENAEQSVMQHEYIRRTVLREIDALRPAQESLVRLANQRSVYQSQLEQLQAGRNAPSASSEAIDTAHIGSPNIGSANMDSAIAANPLASGVVAAAGSSNGLRRLRPGQLELPIHPYQQARYEARGAANVLRLVAHPGSSVLAASRGVIARTQQESDGYVVVVEHDEGHFAVYRGLASVDVAVGSEVLKASRLGRVGEAALVLEIRKGQELVSARDFFGDLR